MPAAKPVNPQETLVLALLKVAERKGWAVLTVEDVAKMAKIKPAAMKKLVNHKSDLLVMLGQWIDDMMWATVEGDIDQTAPEKDRLFEVLMARFDVMQDKRAGLLPILKEFCSDPKDVVIALPHLGSSMASVMETAKIDIQGWQSAVKILGLSAVYLHTLRAWMNDDSDDMAGTMSALDQNLERAERVAGWVGL
jgi:ubiquinone biosynthesis protein COQ9